MKKPLFLQLIIIIIACFSLSLHAQDSAKKTNAVKSPAKPVYSRIADTADQNINTDKSLSGQYKYLLTKVYNYQQPLLAAFHKSIMDTLVQTRHALRDTTAKLSTANKTIDSLNNGIKSSNQSLTESNAKVNAIDFVGMSMPKSTYNLIMWGLVII